MNLLSIGVSIRIQDALRSLLEEAGIEHDRIVSKIEWSKPGHPQWAVAPFDGILEEWTWGKEHRRSCFLIGNVFPEFKGVYDDGGRISKSRRLVVEAAAAGGRRIVEALWDILSQEPYLMDDAERVGFGISGHSVHGSLPDWAQYIGKFLNVPLPTTAGGAHPGFPESIVELLDNWTITKPMNATDRALHRFGKANVAALCDRQKPQWDGLRPVPAVPTIVRLCVAGGESVDGAHWPEVA
eukprot:5147446-Pleurochrysis_carterae.AAC.2